MEKNEITFINTVKKLEKILNNNNNKQIYTFFELFLLFTVKYNVG